MNMNKYLVCVSLVAVALLSGCGSSAKYVETGGRRSVVTVGQINIQDYNQAAEAMINSLLASGVLDRVSNPPAILAISRFVNNTSEQIDIDLLVKKIRVALNKSGKAVTRTTWGLGDTAEDPLAKELEAAAATTAGRKADFTLSGKFIETTVRAGRTQQSTFSFQLSLSDARGLAVWEDEKEITKQGTRPSIGF